MSLTSAYCWAEWRFWVWRSSVSAAGSASPSRRGSHSAGPRCFGRCPTWRTRWTLTTSRGPRQLLPSLCGRDPAALDADGLVRAALESLAENTSDAQVAPLLWTAVGGAPGALVYRAINTLDAMVGYRSPKYARFGWAAARLDDVANVVPARLTAALVVVCAPLVGGSPTGAVRAWRRDAARHPSPNAGVVEAAFAGALGVRLGGPTRYPHGLEIRPALGDGHAAAGRRSAPGGPVVTDGCRRRLWSRQLPLF